MCGRDVSPEQASIERAWKIHRSTGLDFPRRYNVQPTTEVPVLLLDAEFIHYAVNKRVNGARNEGPELLEPLGWEKPRVHRTQS